MSRSSRQTNGPTSLASEAETLLELGKRVRRQTRHGAEIEQTCEELRLLPDHCQLALEFVGSTDVLKLRALVEDWPLDRIAQELAPLSDQPHKPTNPKRKRGHTRMFPRWGFGFRLRPAKFCTTATLILIVQ